LFVLLSPCGLGLQAVVPGLFLWRLVLLTLSSLISRPMPPELREHLEGFCFLAVNLKACAEVGEQTRREMPAVVRWPRFAIRAIRAALSSRFSRLHGAGLGLIAWLEQLAIDDAFDKDADLPARTAPTMRGCGSRDKH
jgi:hypothetical protein